MKKAIFLDRDGVINQKSDGYVRAINEFIILKDVPIAIKLLNDNNFLTIIITNQSAVNRGYLSHDILNDIHEHMKNEFRKFNCHIDAIYYCPHRPDEVCDCRKPNPGLIKQAINDFAIDVKSSWLIGDSESDIESAKRAGVRSIMMETDSSLLDAVKKILRNNHA